MVTAKPSQDRPLRADAQRNRARLLAAAETVFATSGLAVPIEEVAKAAGVGVGTVYRHFPNKEALFEAIVIARTRRLADQTRALVEDGDPHTALFEIVDRVVGEAAVKKDFADALTAAGRDVKSTDEMTEASADMRAALADLLAAGQRVGVVTEDVTIAELFSLLYGLCVAAEHYNWDGMQRARAVTLTFNGLGPR
ncbi:TetR/AcrR family transcriptional regulator [Solihabitans fulvus]|uniref:TetR/AcrR family transcriptional regulator n=1 Tax=Solihabitans fulvus TaxID=1892852 RepID=UPI001661C41C|nr:helix-turn-helix domain-containing protein [Solihabitans fulvus]